MTGRWRMADKGVQGFFSGGWRYSKMDRGDGRIALNYESHSVVYFKWVCCRVSELDLNKAILKTWNVQKQDDDLA